MFGVLEQGKHIPDSELCEALCSDLDRSTRPSHRKIVAFLKFDLYNRMMLDRRAC
jgi:hypothetical protein